MLALAADTLRFQMEQTGHASNGMVLSPETIATVLGAILAWLLRNERRISKLEQAGKDDRRACEKNTREIKESVVAVHERLDSFFTGRDRKT